MVKGLISFVIPVLNEEESLIELHTRISKEVTALGRAFEIIFIDDGSSDNSWNVITEMAKLKDSNIKALKFRQNFGKAQALATGFEHAKGEIVFTLDADLQDDPAEIPRFLQKLNEGYDIVSGWKKVRHDPWHKVLPSRVFNKMLSTVVDVQLHDHNCGFKCYRAGVIKDVKLYGEMHRMVPSLASIKGYKSSEIVVKHHPRQFGQSKYGVKRFARGFMDMITVGFLKNYQERPLHLLGGLAVLSVLGSLVLSGVDLVISDKLGDLSTVLVGLSNACLSASLPLFAIGLLSELVVSRRDNSTNDSAITDIVYNQDSVVSSSKTNDSETTKEDLRPKALVVDDDPRIRRLLEFQLLELGFKVDQACDGKEALSKISQDTAIVLLDIMMPEKNGLECLKEFKQSNANTQIIMISADGQVNKAVEAMKNGAFDYIQKPFSPEGLQQTVLQALKINEVNNQYKEIRH